MRLTTIMTAGLCTLVSATACPQTWRVLPSASIEEVLTDNVNLAPSGQAQGDLVSQLTPGIRVTERTAHTSLTGFVQAPILIYARTGSQNDKVYPEASLVGTYEAVPKFFFLEGAATVQQTFFSPFGAQPPSFANATANRFRTDTYRVTPYIKGGNSRDVRYELRDDNLWTHLSGEPTGVGDSYLNHLSGHVTRDPRPLGFTAEVDRTSEKFVDQSALVTQLARVRIPWQIEPEFQVSGSAGYEDNHYTFTNPHGVIYGAGLEWRHSPRTAVKGQWEHRFFGASYLVTADERTPLSTWNVTASRNITTSSQQLARLTPGVDVQGVLNQILLSRIPDPAQRQTAVDELIQSAGLPSVLTGPVTLFTEQIFLEEHESATVALQGARNRLLFTAFRLRNQAISGTGNPIPPPLNAANDTTQRGATAVWSHTLAPSLAINASLLFTRTDANPPFDGSTRQGSVALTMVSRLSPNTSVHAGIRYQNLHSDITASYREAAIFVGLSYVCCASTSRAATGSQASSTY